MADLLLVRGTRSINPTVLIIVWVLSEKWNLKKGSIYLEKKVCLWDDIFSWIWELRGILSVSCVCCILESDSTFCQCAWVLLFGWMEIFFLAKNVLVMIRERSWVVWKGMIWILEQVQVFLSIYPPKHDKCLFWRGVIKKYFFLICI